MENDSSAAFCTRCGKEFPAPASKMPGLNDLNITPVMKKAAIAIVLNFLLWGLGYWYLGLKKVYGQSWYILIVVQVLAFVVTHVIPLLGIVYLIVWIAFSYDLYEKANGRTGFVPAN
jgi:hypothetical protein